ncbi:MAG: ATP-binding cassette domain-containing protein [Chloroflexota bacterium]|nr:ATP-binding cassette domain-containing protein [Chloroflexota bacterium]
MYAIETHDLVKDFNGLRAVDGLSFAVERGEIFGLLGPNGAGKTTTIRMLMDIFKPDTGEIQVLGGAVDTHTKSRIGYLPEERGLYPRLRVVQCLTYLARLKGMGRREAKNRAEALLDEVGLIEWRRRRVKELSKGMQQKVQFIATIMHDPDLLILDEPFQGLDPINADLLKEMIRELHQAGKTIILSTHMMDQVEQMCDRILLINKGGAVLYGQLAEIKSRYAQHAVLLRCADPPEDLEGVLRIEKKGANYLAFLRSETSPQDVLRQIVARKATITRFEVATPTLEEIFISSVKEGAR